MGEGVPDGPIVLVGDNVDVHMAAGLREFAAFRDRLTIYHLPLYALDLTPWAESGQWHTCASVQLGAGEAVVTLARRLGHSSSAITLGYYAHFTPEAGSKRRSSWRGFYRHTAPRSVMDCKVEEMGGLGNC